MSLHPEELARLEAARVRTQQVVQPKRVLQVAPRKPTLVTEWYTGRPPAKRWVRVGTVLSVTMALLRELGVPCTVRIGWRAQIQQLVLRRVADPPAGKRPGFVTFSGKANIVPSPGLRRWLEDAGVPKGKWKAWVRVAEDGTREIVVDCRTPAKAGRRDG